MNGLFSDSVALVLFLLLAVFAFGNSLSCRVTVDGKEHEVSVRRAYR